MTKKHVKASHLKGKFMRYARYAKDTGLAFGLTEAQFASFWQKSCWYCGAEIKTVSLDRIDNSCGYVLGNVVSCCLADYRAKSSSSQEEYLARCAKVAMRHRVSMKADVDNQFAKSHS